MPDESWVAVREHVMNPPMHSMDGDAVRLLSLETVLQERGIGEPYRPGEAGGWTNSFTVTFRLLVRPADLARAEEIAAAFEADSESTLELDEDFEDFGEPVE